MAKKPEAVVTPKQAVTLKRFDAAALAVRQLKETTTLTKLAETADALYVNAGGASNPKESLLCTRQAVKAAESFGFVEVDREVTVRPAAKG